MLDTRVIKSALDRLLDENDTVFIVPHNRPDFDAIGACIGVSLICKKNKKKNYIVIDDLQEKLEPETRKILEDIYGSFEIIKASDVREHITDKSLMIAVDVNKDYLISTRPYLDEFKSILVLDHHKTDEHTIKTQDIFVDEKLSSTCEEVTRLLLQYGVKLTSDYANYLLAGIILDTNKLSKNTSMETYSVASKLTKMGADPTVANNMFLEDFEHDREVQRLVDNTDFLSYIFAIASDKDDSGKIYDVEDIAKTADYLLKYRVNATFAIARIDEETISVSARSKGVIDVSSIMKLLGGGGNEHSAAAKIKGKSIEEVKEFLYKLLIPTNYLQDDNISQRIVEIEETSKDSESIQGNILKLTI